MEVRSSARTPAPRRARASGPGSGVIPVLPEQFALQDRRRWTVFAAFLFAGCFAYAKASVAGAYPSTLGIAFLLCVIAVMHWQAFTDAPRCALALTAAVAGVLAAIGVPYAGIAVVAAIAGVAVQHAVSSRRDHVPSVRALAETSVPVATMALVLYADAVIIATSAAIVLAVLSLMPMRAWRIASPS